MTDEPLTRTLRVQRPAGPLRGEIDLPGDKSISNRALLFGAIAQGDSRVTGFLRSGDSLATLAAIRALGVVVDELSPTELVVHGRGMRGLQEPSGVIDCSRSGTTMRLLSGICAGQPFLSILSGEAQLLSRPMARIVQPLQQMGATVLGRAGDRLPPLAIRSHAEGLGGIDHTLPVASAQVKSCLLLAALYARSPSIIRTPGPARDHTERMLAAMGAPIEDLGGYALRVHPCPELEAADVTVPGDFSSAAYFLVAALLVPGSEVTVRGVGINPTRTGLLDVVQAMGAEVHLRNEHSVSGEPVADIVARQSSLRGATVAGELVVRMIDEFPILAVAATQAHGETVVRDAAELRVKESDRIATTVAELVALGADIEPRPDGFVIRGPTPLRGTRVHSHGDHRLAMALAVAGLAASGETTITDADAMDKSFPEFAALLGRLGGQTS